MKNTQNGHIYSNSLQILTESFTFRRNTFWNVNTEY